MAGAAATHDAARTEATAAAGRGQQVRCGREFQEQPARPLTYALSRLLLPLPL